MARRLPTLAQLPKARPNKRHRQSSPAQVQQSLITLYHQTPTFFPLVPSLLPSLINPILAPSNHFSGRPSPSPLSSIALAKAKVETTSIKFSQADAGGLDFLTTKLDELTHCESSLGIFGSGFGSSSSSSSSSASRDGDEATRSEARFATHRLGASAPLKTRLTRMLDAVHGTSSGGLAGLHSLEENGDAAMEWRHRVQFGREEERQREEREEREHAEWEREQGLEEGPRV